MAGVPGQPPEPLGFTPRAMPDAVRGWARFRLASAEALFALGAWLLLLLGSMVLGALAALLLRFSLTHVQALAPGAHPGFWRSAALLLQALLLPLLATISALVLIPSACVVALCAVLLLLPGAALGTPIYFATRLVASPATSVHAAAGAFLVAALAIVLRLVSRRRPAAAPAEYGIPGFLAWYYLACAALAAFVPYERWSALAAAVGHALSAMP